MGRRWQLGDGPEVGKWQSQPGGGLLGKGGCDWGCLHGFLSGDDYGGDGHCAKIVVAWFMVILVL